MAPFLQPNRDIILSVGFSDVMSSSNKVACGMKPAKEMSQQDWLGTGRPRLWQNKVGMMALLRG